MSWSADERGQIAPLLALFAAAIGLACLGLGRFAGGAVDAASARTAADAAALAAAADGSEPAARALAAENGATLESFERAGDDVRVRVRVGPSVVSARARAAPVHAGTGTGSAASTDGLAPALVAALARAAQLLGHEVPVTSGFRSVEEQHRLWLGRAINPYPVAPPGASMHQRGLAVDVSASTAERLAEIGPDAGLCRPYPKDDPVHFELCGRRLSAQGHG